MSAFDDFYAGRSKCVVPANKGMPHPLPLYHPCLGTPSGKAGRMKTGDATHIPGAWADLDTGKGKHFETVEEIHAFLDELPMTTTARVDSGGGVHAFWLFDDEEGDGDLAEDERLRTLPQRFLLWLEEQATGKIDHLHDLARGLRQVGCENHKYDPPRVVTLVQDDGPRYMPGDFWSLGMPVIEEKVIVSEPAGPRILGELRAMRTGQCMGDSVDLEANAFMIDVIMENHPELGSLWNNEPGAFAKYDKGGEEGDSEADLGFLSHALYYLRAHADRDNFAVALARECRRRVAKTEGDHAKCDRADYWLRTYEKARLDQHGLDRPSITEVRETPPEDLLQRAGDMTGLEIKRIVRIEGVGTYVLELADGRDVGLPEGSLNVAGGPRLFYGALSSMAIPAVSVRKQWELLANTLMQASVTRDDGEASRLWEFVRAALMKMIASSVVVYQGWGPFRHGLRTAPSVRHAYVHIAGNPKKSGFRFFLADLMAELRAMDLGFKPAELTTLIHMLGGKPTKANLGDGGYQQMWSVGGEFLEAAQARSEETDRDTEQLEGLLGDGGA